MNKISYLIIAISISLLSCTSAKHNEQAENSDWKLSMQSYTLHRFNVIEALEKTEQLGLKYIEIYPGQNMGPGFESETFGYNLDTEEQLRLKDLAKSKGIKIISSGVWVAERNEWENIFNFAMSMELEFISAEPSRKDWDIIENLAKQYNIKVAVHNHPNENSYWKPEILLDYIKNRSSLLGACADVGHYKRMNVNPISALQELEGRLISLHFKDISLDNKNNSLEDVIWGAGVLNVKELMKEIKRQNFKGYFTIEYEANWDNNLPEIQQSINYFRNVMRDLDK